MNEQCIGQNPATTGSLTWSLLWWVTSSFSIYTCSSTNPKNSCMQHLSPAVGRSASSVAQKCPLSLGPWVVPFQDGYKVILRLFLITKGNCTSLQGVSDIPASSPLYLGLLAFHARSFFSHKLPLLISYNPNFPFKLPGGCCVMKYLVHITFLEKEEPSDKSGD